MKNTYVCPHCQGVLNPNVKILLVAEFRKSRGMLLLSPQPGNYKFTCDKSFEDKLERGKLVDFSCPMCGENLEDDHNRKFARIEMLAPGHAPRQVAFSRTFGTHATFILDGEDISSFGEDAEDFGSTNFFGA
ncbi:hypothetical protein KDM41_09790 [bacterium]|nr:hypothetical protein [bacterium]